MVMMAAVPALDPKEQPGTDKLGFSGFALGYKYGGLTTSYNLQGKKKEKRKKRERDQRLPRELNYFRGC